MKKVSSQAVLSSAGLIATLMISHVAFAATPVINLAVTKDFTGGYNAKVYLDSTAKAMLGSNPTFSFSLGHAIKSAFGSTIVTNTASQISLNNLSGTSIGFTDTNATSNQISASTCSYANQPCILQWNGVTVWSPSGTPPTSTPVPTATPRPTATPTSAPVATATPIPSATPVATASPTRVPTSTPTPTASTGGVTYNVDNIRDLYGKLGLNTVLGMVNPGDTIVLADGTYDSVAAITRSGAKGKPITLRGSNKAIITKGGYSGYGLSLKNVNYWKLEGFTVTKALKGIMLDTSNNNIINGVTVTDIGQEAVHFRYNSSNNVLQNATISLTGQKDAGYGEGVYIGSAKSNWVNGLPDEANNNCVEKTTFGAGITAEGIDIKEGTKGGLILSNNYDAVGIMGVTAANYADSFIDVKGNEYLIYNNTITNPTRNQLFLDGYQTHAPSGTTGQGSNNTFQKNTTQVGNANGYAFNIDSKTSGNKVCSDNIWSDASGLITGGSAVSCSAPTVTVCPNVINQ